jgi:cytochrome c peroxidase
VKRIAVLLAILAIGCNDGNSGSPAAKPATKPEPAKDAATSAEPNVPDLPDAPQVPPAPRALPPTPSPDHNPTTADKVALGKLLFFDNRLSRDRSMSCATCHDPDKGWSDGKARSKTVAGKINLRHTPSLYNTGYHKAWYWDGSMDLLESMILSNWTGQMSANPAAIAARLERIPRYRSHFGRAFNSKPSRDRIAEALAAFVRTIRSGDSPWDRHESGIEGEVSDDAIAGFAVFHSRAGCGLCHTPPLYTDLGYHDVDLPTESSDPDEGRFRVTNKPSERNAFKTQGLRDVARSAPYFHDGSVATLTEAIDHQLRRQKANLTADERRQLEAFLLSLSTTTEPYERPVLPASTP